VDPGLNLLFDLVSYYDCFGESLFLGACKCGRVVKIPMKAFRDARENRAPFAACFIAHSYDIVVYSCLDEPRYRKSDLLIDSD